MTPMIKIDINQTHYHRPEDGIVKTAPNFSVTDAVSRKIEFKAHSRSNSGLVSKSFESFLDQLALLISGKEFALLNTLHYT